MGYGVMHSLGNDHIRYLECPSSTFIIFMGKHWKPSLLAVFDEHRIALLTPVLLCSRALRLTCAPGAVVPLHPAHVKGSFAPDPTLPAMGVLHLALW